MKALFFGIYDPEYSRNRVLMRGFRENGWDVSECRTDPKIDKGLRKYARLWRRAKKIPSGDVDLVFVAFPGHTAVWLAKILFPRKRIVMDAFLSLYDSNVFDRKIYGKRSFGALRDYILDLYSVRLADDVLVDTEEHRKYFSSMFGANPSKTHVVPISADDEVFFPRKVAPKEERAPFVVHFHGTFIPLQGIDYILDAAKQLGKEFEFRIVGHGQLFASAEERVKSERIENVKLLGKTPFEKVPEAISQGDICLGIFGDTEKAARVVPNKVYECVAMEKPVVTADTAAIREVFRGGEDVILCDRASGKSLASALMAAKNDPELLSRVASRGRAVFEAKLRPKAIVSRLLTELNE